MATENTNSGWHYGYVIVVCCCLIMGINVGLVMSCAGIFYKPVSQELGVSVGQFGLYMSFNYLASSLMLSVAGRMMQRYSARWLLTVSSALLGVTVIGMSMADHLWQFYVAGAVIGITMAFLLYLSFPTLVNRWFKTRVGLFFGICSAASGIGGVLFNPLGQSRIEHYGWRTTYLLFGLAMLIIVTPLLALLLRDYPKDKGLLPFGCGIEEKKATAAPAEGMAYKDALCTPLFYMLIIFAFLMIAVSTLNLFIPSYVSEIGFLGQAGLVASSVMVGVTIGKVALGMINDRSTLTGVAVTMILGIAGLLLMLFGGIGLWVVIAGGFLFGWAYAGVTVQTPMLVRSVFGTKDYAQIYSNISIAFSVGGALMSGGWGLLADGTSYSFILSLGIAFLVICGIIGIYALKKNNIQRVL